MKRPSLLLLFLLILPAAAPAQNAADSISLAAAEWQVSLRSDGVVSRRTQAEMFGSVQTISVVEYPAGIFSTAVLPLDGRGEITSRAAAQHGADIAINGSYFDMATFRPTTFLSMDGVIMARTSPDELFRVNGVVAFGGAADGARVDILMCDTTDYADIAARYDSALAAGPVLIVDGREIIYDIEDGFYDRRHPRSVIGRTGDGRVIMAVIDGRHPGHAEGATIAETAYIARQLGMTDAINLDGGGSSALWTTWQGVVSHPSDNGLFDHEGERPVPNFIIAISGSN